MLAAPESPANAGVPFTGPAIEPDAVALPTVSALPTPTPSELDGIRFEYPEIESVPATVFETAPAREDELSGEALLSAAALDGLPSRPPSAAGMSAARLSVIDRVVSRGIAAGGYPGASVVVGRGGYAVYQKGFGRLDW